MIDKKSTVRVLIVEDDPITARDLREILEGGGMEVAGVANEFEKAVELYHSGQPDVLLIDVKLNGIKTGIDFARYVRSSKKDLPIVYLTANSDLDTKSYAFDTNPEGFLTKPFIENNVIVSLELALNKFMRSLAQSNGQQPDYLFIKVGERLFKIQLSDILYLEAAGSYTKIVTDDNQFIQTGSLNYFESKLKYSFIRIHRSYLANKERLESLDAQRVFLNGDISLPIGRKFRDQVKLLVR